MSLPKFKICKSEYSLLPDGKIRYVFTFNQSGDDAYIAGQDFTVEIPNGEIRVTTTSEHVRDILAIGHEYTVSVTPVA